MADTTSATITAAAATAAGTDPLVLYDISSPLQPRSYAPNPSKARLVLSFKHVPFQTTWVDILDIPDVRKGLKCPAVRKLDDGSDYYTLPMLQVCLKKQLPPDRRGNMALMVAVKATSC